MALTDNISLSDIAAVTRGNYGGFGDFGFGGGQGWWILLLFLFAMNGGGGNGGFGGGNGAIPFMMGQTNTSNDVQRGFDQQALMAGLGNLNNAVSNGFANAEVSRCNAQANLLQTLNQNQNATTQAINGLAFANQAGFNGTTTGIADLKYTVATEACADRQAVGLGIRDVIANQTANTNTLATTINNGIQSINDKLCQLELDNVKRENEQLRSQLNMAALAASQSSQTAQLIQDNNAQTAALINRIAPAPVPAYSVPNPYAGYGYGCAGCGAA